jgi:hypothetical protein
VPRSRRVQQISICLSLVSLHINSVYIFPNIGCYFTKKRHKITQDGLITDKRVIRPKKSLWTSLFAILSLGPGFDSGAHVFLLFALLFAVRRDYRLKPIEVWGNNRFVMPLDVLGCTRATLTELITYSDSQVLRATYGWRLEEYETVAPRNLSRYLENALALSGSDTNELPWLEGLGIILLYSVVLGIEQCNYCSSSRNA